MLHLGDITKISGYEAPIVDCIIGGSPCQDLSVAGKRAGLDGERSGLFMEQLRIVKEMRERDRRNGRSDEHIRPRYMVWENVPGAFSSNKAEDFRIVLEEIAKVCDKDAVIPMPNNGKWTTAGCIVGAGWSIAWRVCDAQFYGVPQRRRRIALIADFGGHSAPEILFVRKSVSRDTESSQPQRKATTTDASRSFGADDIFCIDGDKLNKKERNGGSGMGVRDGDKQYTLTAKDVHGVVYEAAGFCPEEGAKAHSIGYEEERSPSLRSSNVPGVAYCFEPGAAKRLGGYVWEDLAPTLRTEVGDNRPSVAYTMQDREGKAGGGKGALVAEELSATLRAGFAQTLFQPVQCIDQGGGKSSVDVKEGKAPTLTTTHDGAPAVCYSVENHPADSRVDIDESGKVQTLTSRMGTGGGNVPMVMECYSKSKRAQTDTDYETWKESDVANTLNAFDVGDKRTTECVVCAENEEVQCLETFHCTAEDGLAHPLKARDYKDPHCIVYKSYGFDPSASRDVGQYFHEESANVLKNGTCPGHHNGVVVAIDSPMGLGIQSSAGIGAMADNIMPTLINGDNPGWQNGVCHSVDCRNGTENDVNGALQSNMAHSLNGNNVVRVKYIVRRLTPLECERLQGYPDGWTDIGEWTDSKGKVHKTSDAQRYKALGNSIALPPWKWVLKRLCACYERDATLGSLFDGISGFPLIWTQLNGPNSVKFTSEIEEFPMAVCKKHFGDEVTGEEGDFYEAIQGK